MADWDDDLLPPKRVMEMRKFTPRSASMPIPMIPSYESDAFVSHTGPLHGGRTTQFARSKTNKVSGPTLGENQNKSFAVTPVEISQNWMDSDHGGRNVHLLNSGPLVLCNNPDCTTCPEAYKIKQRNYNLIHPDRKLHNILYGDAEGWARKSVSFFNRYFPIMNPHTKLVQQWKRFFIISCLVAIFTDPLFSFLFSVQMDNKCIVLNWSLATPIAAVRSVTDFIYLVHMLLQFRLAYVTPESRVVGTSDLVVQPKKIALHYLRGYFLPDLFVVFPLPQVMILVAIPTYMGSSALNYPEDLLLGTEIFLLQNIPRTIRFLLLLDGQSASGSIFKSAWIIILIIVWTGNVVGSYWYIFGLQRVSQCLRDACSLSKIADCELFLDCGKFVNSARFYGSQAFQDWIKDSTSRSCFSVDNGSFEYGIYQQAVPLTTTSSFVGRCTYSFFWGLQQISTLAGNLSPSHLEGEVIFTISIILVGLVLFPLLIGNMQNFLEAFGRRRLEREIRLRDVEKWTSHRRLPEELQRQVLRAERFRWVVTRGVNEEELLENFPEDIQREIRRHFFKFIRKVRIFTLMDDHILDAICEKLRQNLYIGGSDILHLGGPVEKMVFIVRGKVESIGADGNIAPLSEGDVCGEELLTWYLEYSTVNKDGGKIRFPGQRLYSTRTVKCLTNVEAFVLRDADLEEVTALFARFLRNPRVQGAIRYESPYWRNIAATRIQVAWRYRQRRLKRSDNSSSHMSARSDERAWRSSRHSIINLK